MDGDGETFSTVRDFMFGLARDGRSTSKKEITMSYELHTIAVGIGLALFLWVWANRGNYT